MNLKNIFLFSAHLIILLAILVLVVNTIRYVSHFFSSTDTLGDKAIILLYVTLTLGVLIIIAGCFLGKIQFDNILLQKALKYIELGIPLTSIIINFFVTVLNIKNL